MAKPGGMVLAMVTTLAVALGGLLLIPAAPAYADTGTPPAPNAGVRIDERLARLYGREQSWLKVQADNLTRANEMVAKAQARIDDWKNQGKDTTALETALTALKGQIAAAQAAHDQAADILAAHAGFDDSGKVTDREQARQTVRDAGESLRDVQLDLKEARLDLL
jgi:hypothetical protein